MAAQIRINDFSMTGVQIALNQLARMISQQGTPAAPRAQQVSMGGQLVLGSSSAGGDPHQVTIQDVAGLEAELKRLAGLIQTGGVAAATETSLGVVKISCDPSDPANPVVLCVDDPILDSIKSWTHTQSTASAQWVVNHGLGFLPTITVVDSGGNLIEPAVDHSPAHAPTITVLTFFAETSGTARFS